MRRPHEHRPLGLFDVPADAVEPVDQRVAPAAVDLVLTSFGKSGASFIATVAAIWMGWNVP